MGGNDPSIKLVSNFLRNLNSNMLNWGQELRERQREDLVMVYFLVVPLQEIHSQR